MILGRLRAGCAREPLLVVVAGLVLLLLLLLLLALAPTAVQLLLLDRLLSGCHGPFLLLLILDWRCNRPLGMGCWLR